MKEQPKVKMSVDMGRDFMMIDPIWFDTNMCESARTLTTPDKNCPASEKIKYTLCAHALNTYAKRNAAMTPDGILELLWFTHGFAPCSLEHKGIAYVALVSIRGICWVSHPPVDFVDPDGNGYGSLVKQATRVRNNLREAISQERQIR